MAAPDFATLYDFETQMEDALASAITTILTAASITAPVSVTRDTQIDDTPRVEVTFSPGNALTQRTAIGQAMPKQVANAFQGSYSVKIITSRQLVDDNAELHGTIRGWVRYVLTAGAKGFNTSNLPYIQILEMLPTSATAQIYDEKQQDISELNHEVWFAIRNDAWPVTTPSSAWSSAFSNAFG
jgi:hypothetical protein